MPSFAASEPASRYLELVMLKGSTGYVVRDVTDLNHPSTVSTLGGLAPISGPKAAYSIAFAASSDVSYEDDSGQQVRQPFAGTPVAVARSCMYQFGFTWSNDGTTAAYASEPDAPNNTEMHILSAGIDHSVGTMPAILLGDCACDSQIRALFSPDGRYVSFASSFGSRFIRIWSTHGELVASVDGTGSSGPTMAVWSGSSLYYADSRGVERWSDGSTTMALPGVNWLYPRASSGTAGIVYEARDPAGLPGVYLFDPSSDATRKLASMRSSPVFLNPTTVWYVGERTCTAADKSLTCAAFKTTPTGVSYVLNLTTGVESQSVIDAVWDTWPHAA